MPSMSLPDVDLAVLRAWAEAGVISHARYVEEVERRRQEQKKLDEFNYPIGDLFNHPL